MCTLYGGRHKRQKQNFVRVPAGSIGYARGPFSDEYGLVYYKCQFDHVHVRCSRNTFVIQDDE